MSLLDMTGKPCPIPVIEAKKALKTLSPGESVSLLVDNDIARQNLQKMAEGMGHAFGYEAKADKAILATITVSQACVLDDSGGTGLVVAIGRDTMGQGSDELGKALMKSFIYSLTELDTPPEHMLFFNGGVRLTTGDASTLDDLTTLAEKGTVINSCGACLNFFELSDQLKVGAVTNMYAILATMSQATRLINL